MSLILASLIVGAICASASGGYLMAMRKGRARTDGGGGSGDGKGDPAKDDPAKGEAGGSGKGVRKQDPPPAPSKKKRDALDRHAFEDLPLALGDVVIADREERWLAGGLLAKEGDRVVAALFFAPEGAAVKIVAAFARPRREVLWLSPSQVDSPAEPPASVEIDGVAMTRRGRLPVMLSRHGQGVPKIGETGILAEYEGGADDVALLVTSEGRAFAWSGKKLAEGEYDRLGSGGDES